MSKIENQIRNKIYTNTEGAISGNILQDVLMLILNRDVFLSESAYNKLVRDGEVDEDKIYHVYED